MTQILLPILLFMLPVLTIVVLATRFGRRLRGSCGGVGPDGSCTRCGKPAAAMPGLDRAGAATGARAGAATEHCST